VAIVRFESDSHVSLIEPLAFAKYASLPSIVIPSSLQTMLHEYEAFQKVIVPEGAENDQSFLADSDQEAR
jgi:hypothetical protein